MNREPEGYPPLRRSACGDLGLRPVDPMALVNAFGRASRGPGDIRLAALDRTSRDSRRGSGSPARHREHSVPRLFKETIEAGRKSGRSPRREKAASARDYRSVVNRCRPHLRKSAPVRTGGSLPDRDHHHRRAYGLDQCRLPFTARHDTAARSRVVAEDVQVNG